MQQPITWARRWWNETPRQIQLFTYVLIPTGIAMFCGGLWLDHTDWWTGHDFLLNVASSLTGLCFGGPLALLLFNHLGNTQDEARQAARARDRASEGAAAFQQTLLSLFNTPDLTDLTAKVGALQDQLSGIRDARDPALTDFLSAFDALLPSSSGRPHQNFGSFQRNGEWAQLREWRTRMLDRWNTLHTEVRPSLPTGGWIAEGPATAAQQATRDLLLPGRNPWKHAGEHGAVVAMRNFLHDIDALCRAATALEIYK